MVPLTFSLLLNEDYPRNFQVSLSLNEIVTFLLTPLIFPCSKHYLRLYIIFCLQVTYAPTPSIEQPRGTFNLNHAFVDFKTDFYTLRELQHTFFSDSIVYAVLPYALSIQHILYASFSYNTPKVSITYVPLHLDTWDNKAIWSIEN